MKKSILLCSTIFLALSACGRGSMPPEENDKCSPAVAEMILSAELNLKIFKIVGLQAGQNLTESHRLLKNVIENHSYFSCEGVDHETGEIVIANPEYLSRYERITYDLLMQSRRFCQLSERKSLDEKKGCSFIELYFRDVLKF